MTLGLRLRFRARWEACAPGQVAGGDSNRKPWPPLSFAARRSELWRSWTPDHQPAGSQNRAPGGQSGSPNARRPQVCCREGAPGRVPTVLCPTRAGGFRRLTPALKGTGPCLLRFCAAASSELLPSRRMVTGTWGHRRREVSVPRVKVVGVFCACSVGAVQALSQTWCGRGVRTARCGRWGRGRCGPLAPVRLGLPQQTLGCQAR